MFFANPNLAAGAEFAINNINERLEKKDLSEVDHADLIRALKHLKEACASRQFREVCKSDDACLVVQGLSDVVSRAYDVNADFIMRSVGNYQNGALIPSIRVSHMRLALGLLRSRSDEDTQWKTADDLEEELTTAGLKQLEEMYKAEHPSRFKVSPIK